MSRLSVKKGRGSLDLGASRATKSILRYAYCVCRGDSVLIVGFSCAGCHRGTRVSSGDLPSEDAVSDMLIIGEQRMLELKPKPLLGSGVDYG